MLDLSLQKEDTLLPVRLQQNQPARDQVIRILLIEDDEDDYVILKDLLAEVESAIFQLVWASTFDAGLEILNRQDHDVYLVDYHLGERNGLEFLHEALAAGCTAPILLLTGLGGREVDILAMQAGAADYLPKAQLTAQLLERSIRYAIERKRSEALIRSLNARLEQGVRERTAQLEAATRKLQRANEVLAILDGKQKDFINIAAHELHTPLTVLKGYTNIMSMEPGVTGDPHLMKILVGINQGADRLHEVVNAMLAVRRIDSDKLQVIPEDILLSGLIYDLLQALEAQAASRVLKFTFIPWPEKVHLFADPDLLQKALYHVIINAIKYTPDGGEITIRERLVAMDDGQPGVQICVTDTGIGIDPQHQELIFEKFFQVGSITFHSTGKVIYKGGGPGLGLTIARGIVLAHQGKIWVESWGHDETTFPGSTFYIQLPASTAPAAASALA